MSREIIIINVTIIFYILQRVSEIFISKNNERWLIENLNAVEVDKNEGMRMRIFHSLWFVSLIVEANVRASVLRGIWGAVIIFVLGICMMIRLYSIGKLGRFWTIKIFSMTEQEVYTGGLYKLLRHPNYLMVITEFILIPLLFHAYATLIIFSLINYYILSKRIKLEEETLMKQSDYSSKFVTVKRFIPFIFSFLLCLNLSSAEIHLKFKDYEEAKKAENYIKFEGASTKFGLITTSYDGYAKEAKIKYEILNNIVTSLEVDVPAKALDTDVNSRNEKMWDLVLENEKFPAITVKAVDKTDLNVDDQSVDMVFNVRDHKVTKQVIVKVVKNEKGFLVLGKTSLSIKELELPDPSIAIAKVKDNLDLTFNLQLIK